MSKEAFTQGFQKLLCHLRGARHPIRTLFGEAPGTLFGTLFGLECVLEVKAGSFEGNANGASLHAVGSLIGAF